MTQEQLDALLAEARAQREEMATRAMQHAVTIAQLRAQVQSLTARMAESRPVMAEGEPSGDTRHD